MRRTYKGKITKLEKNEVFVFGSNTEGRHGMGAARDALMHFGAHYAKSMGIQGQSYAIVTKDLTKKEHPSVPQSLIVEQIEELYRYAREHADKLFYVAYSGKGKNLNGYTNRQMADMFNIEPIPENIVFEESFSKLLL